MTIYFKETMTEKKRTGFAALPAEKMREIAAAGGRTAHEQGRAYRFTPEKAREAARKSHAARRAKRDAAASTPTGTPTED